MKLRITFCILAVLCATLQARQTQPDAKRVKQIQAALEEHGYEAGKNWHETQEILRGIAKYNHWQIHRAPDARVLILLGLGNKYSDPTVALEGLNYLDHKKTEDSEAEKP